MKVGVLFGFQNDDWIRYETNDFTKPPAIRDGQIYEDNLYLCDLLEPLGFDVLFNVEHHGSPHHMTGNPLDVLKYMAGRTERLEMGSAVVVLPWWHPLRAAEEICVLDHLVKGRKLWLGLGRGAAPREYKHLGVNQSEARDRFKEGLEILKLAFTSEQFSYEGDIYKLHDVVVRPRPRSEDLADRMFGAITTEGSLEIVAQLGLNLMFTGGSSVDDAEKLVGIFNKTRLSAGLEPGRPIIAAPAYCSADEAEANERGQQFVVDYMTTGEKHYQRDKPELFKGVKGYESYVPSAEKLVAQGAGAAPRDWGVYGTPDQCIKRIRTLVERTGSDFVTLLVQIGTMTREESERSLRLFAKEVLPALREMEDAPFVTS
jgi:alkanesulfonate monooxygenase SsuD/methylene tetrahydromethanopterin reductase-like flavin-dependent oxidoreductase (luciferase family)